MFESIYTFMTEVPVASPVLKSVITVAEILVLGVCLYWIFENIPVLFNSIRRLLAGKRTTAYEAAELEKAHLTDIPAA